MSVEDEKVCLMYLETPWRDRGGRKIWNSSPKLSLTRYSNTIHLAKSGCG